MALDRYDALWRLGRHFLLPSRLPWLMHAACDGPDAFLGSSLSTLNLEFTNHAWPQNATWSINYIKVYEKTVIDNSFLSGAVPRNPWTLPLVGSVIMASLCLLLEIV